jgi:hypothetical protein
MNRAISPFRFRSRGTTLAVTAAAVLPSLHADAPSRGPRTRSTARGGRLARPVLDRAAFESLIVRERKRTDRSSEAFLLGRLPRSAGSHGRVTCSGGSNLTGCSAFSCRRSTATSPTRAS